MNALIILVVLSVTSSLGQIMLKEPIEDYCRKVLRVKRFSLTWNYTNRFTC